jgi:hypothetical protein
MQKHRGRAVATALLAVALAALGLAGTAQAKLVGNYTKFAQCPYSNLEVRKCIYSVTTSGEVTLGAKKVPIEKPVILQGGTLAQNEEGFSKSPQNVPGGLLGIVPEASQPALVKALIKFFFENSLTGVNSTLELAKPASEIVVSENNLAAEEGVALKMPVKFHLENPFLGSGCYVGSSSNPIIWNLTTGTTSPPAPNTPITGKAGFVEFLEEGRIALSKEAVLVDNAWAAPGTNGCGGFLVELILDPIINSASGLPASAGHNTAILKNELNIASAAAVRKNNAENP